MSDLVKADVGREAAGKEETRWISGPVDPRSGTIMVAMTTTAVTTSHIVLDEQGRPWIEGTNTKVIEVVLDRLAYGWSPEEMHLQHPHLPLARIHAALAYYYDHQVEMDEQIHQQMQQVEAMRAAAGESPLLKRLREMGKLASLTTWS